jgi:integrase
MKKMKSKRVQIKGVDGKRRNLVFPTCATKEEVRHFKTVAQRMVRCRIANTAFYPQDLEFIAVHGPSMQKKLALLGVTHDATSSSNDATLCSYLSKYTSGACGESERKLIDVARRLEKFFGPRKDMREIQKTDAQRFWKWLVEKENLAENSTARRHIAYASQIMDSAVHDGILAKNPFKGRDLPKQVHTDQSKWHHIDAHQTLKLWNAIQDDEDRVRFVLLRFLGLRAPSEINALTWKDVNWTEQTITIRSKKLRHHKHGGVRVCPISWADVLPTLTAAYEGRASDDEPMVTSITGTALRRRAIQWLGRAGLDIWPQLFVNFRRSAITDAADQFPSHVVANWFGHSETIAKKHYRMETAAHAKAVSKAPSILRVI